MITIGNSTKTESQNGRHPLATVLATVMVLNVEDNEKNRLVIGDMIRAYGMTPVNAADSTEALALYEKWSNWIVMAIVDVILPGLSGWELALKLKLPNPRLPILFSSGYSVDAVRINEYDSFISKPFTRHELYEKIDRMHLFLQSHSEDNEPDLLECF